MLEEHDFENEDNNVLVLDGVEQPNETKIDTQFEKAKEIGNTWKFEGKEYPLMVINGLYHSGIPIVHPNDNKHVANLIGDFLTEDSEVFFEHLDVERKQIFSAKDDFTKTVQKNLTKKNESLYNAIVQSGVLQKLDEDGEIKEEITKNRQQMLSYPQEYKSALITEWLNNFHIERYFPEGEGDAVDALLNPPTSVWFLVKVGDKQKPAHLLLFEFNAPDDEARRTLEDKAFNMSWKDNTTGRVTNIDIDYGAKFRFAKKYFAKIDGVSIEKPSNPFDGSKEHITSFKTNFNPHFWIRLADMLMDAFAYTKKSELT